MTYNVVTVDDHEDSRFLLRELIRDYFTELRIVGEASDGHSAVEMIQKSRPDLVFLDIGLPDMTGLEVAETCCRDIFVIFITAYREYVFDAFKALAVEYIIKPIEYDKLKTAVDKFKKIFCSQRNDETRGQYSHPSSGSDRFKVSAGNTTRFIEYDDIAYFKADRKYVELITVEMRNYIVDNTLQELESMLPQTEFMRIHRKYIVNRRHVGELHRLGDRKYSIILNDTTEDELKVGRNFLHSVKKIR